MDQQLKLWLAPPILMGLASIYFRRQIPFAWSWPFLVQGILLVLVGACGYLTGPEAIFVILSWLLFFIFLALPKFLIGHCDQFIGLLNSRKLYFYSRILPLVYWGQMGAFWRDNYIAYALGIDGNSEAGADLLESWNRRDLPLTVRAQLDGNKVAFQIINWQWNAVIRDFEARRAQGTTIATTLCIQAARAYSEVGRFEEAGACLEASRLPEMKLQPAVVAQILLPYFCLTGSTQYAQKLSAIIEGDKKVMALFLLNYWQARLSLANNDVVQASQQFEKSLASAKMLSDKGQTNYLAWKQRINMQLEKSQTMNQAGLPLDPESNESLKLTTQRVWKLFEESTFVSSRMLPNKAPAVVVALCVCLLIAYCLSGCVDLVSSDWAKPLLNLNVAAGNAIVALSEKLGTFAFNNCLLDKQAVFGQGQCWRLFTYMFLHGNVTHLFLNALGLYWFGRMAAHIYGARGFVSVFVLTGVLAGLAQITFSDVPAIGASGGVLGVFGADFIGVFRLGDKLPANIRKAELKSMSVLAVSQLIMDHIIPKVAAEAHIGGLVAGLLIGFFLPLSTSSTSVDSKN